MVNAAGSSNPQLVRLVRRRRADSLLAAGLVIDFACHICADLAAVGGVSGRALAARAAPLTTVLGMTISLQGEYG